MLLCLPVSSRTPCRDQAADACSLNIDNLACPGFSFGQLPSVLPHRHNFFLSSHLHRRNRQARPAPPPSTPRAWGGYNQTGSGSNAHNDWVSREAGGAAGTGGAVRRSTGSVDTAATGIRSQQGQAQGEERGREQPHEHRRWDDGGLALSPSCLLYTSPSPRD